MGEIKRLNNLTYGRGNQKNISLVVRRYRTKHTGNIFQIFPTKNTKGKGDSVKTQRSLKFYKTQMDDLLMEAVSAKHCYSQELRKIWFYHKV